MNINTSINSKIIFEIPEEIINQTDIDIINKKDFNFIDYSDILPSNKIFQLKDIYVYKDLISNTDDEFLSQFSWFGDEIDKYSSLIEYTLKNCYKKKLKPLKLDGISLYLGSTWGNANIGHNVLDGLSRMASYDMANIDLLSIDHFLVHYDPEILYILSRMGIPSDKIKDINTSCYQCKNLIIAETPGRKRQYKKIIANYFNKILNKGVRTSNDKIFLNNRKTRRPINIEDIKNIVLKNKYSIYDDYPQHEIFTRSSSIISPHSSTLYKLIFCYQDTSILELISSDHMYSYYYELCRIFNLKYTGLLCEAKIEKENIHKMQNNFIVDITFLEKWIKDNLY